MSDLVERLRRYRPRDDWGVGEHHTICDEAAGEIERLTRELAGIVGLLKDPAAVRINYLRGDIACQPLIDEARKAAFIEAAVMCTGWLDNFTDTPIATVPANVFASDAVRDIRAAIRAKTEETGR